MSSHFALRAVPSTARPRTRTPVPRASELVIKQGPAPRDTPRRDLVKAPIILTIIKITDVTGDVWPEPENPGIKTLPLYQIQISQDEKARPNVLYNFKSAFEAFLSHGQSADATPLPSLQELERVGIKFVNSKPDDPDGVGVMPWRKAFYVAGEAEAKPVSNFLLLLDGFWKAKESELQHKFDVEIHPHVSADVSDVWEDLEYDKYCLEDPAAVLPLKFWEAAPVIGKRVVSMYLQMNSEGAIDVLFGGQTYAFKAGFDSLGIQGGMAGGSYFRKIENVSVDDPECMQLLEKALGNGALNDLAVRVVVEGECEEDGLMGALVQSLSKRSCCHFAK